MQGKGRKKGLRCKLTRVKRLKRAHNKQTKKRAKRGWGIGKKKLAEKRSTPKNIQLESHAQKKSLKVADIMKFFHKTPILVKKV